MRPLVCGIGEMLEVKVLSLVIKAEGLVACVLLDAREIFHYKE